MGGSEGERYRAGASLEDLCRSCKLMRQHTVMTATADGKPLRVVCDYCGSHHNYRGGSGRVSSRERSAKPRGMERQPLPLASERERSAPPMSEDAIVPEGQDLELLLRRIIREEAGLSPVAPAAKWLGGEMVLRPGKPGLQEKSWPIETLFQKIVMIRNRLRVLEQQINSSELAADAKLKLQNYVTACYGSLTSFNVLFAEEQDRFHGAGSRAGEK
jgi:hypothetical protein